MYPQIFLIIAFHFCFYHMEKLPLEIFGTGWFIPLAHNRIQIKVFLGQGTCG